MPTIHCLGCEASLRLNDDYVGKRVKCPKCATAFVVPQPQTFEEDPLFRIQAPPSTPPVQYPMSGGAPTTPGFNSPGQTLPSYLQPASSAPPSKYEAMSAELAKKLQTKAQSAAAMQHIGLGVVMMLGSVIWFFGGLYVGILFYYPPLLFVVGIITVVKGCFGYSE